MTAIFRYLSAAWILCLLFAACSSQKTVLPIPEDKLVSIVAEATVLEAGIKELVTAAQDTLRPQIYEKLLSEHGFTQEQFLSTMQMLHKDSKRQEKFYEKVVLAVEQMEAEMKKE